MRLADQDEQGCVGTATYVDYLQEARVDMMRNHARHDESGAITEGLVVVRHRLDHVAPLTVTTDSVSIECWVSELRMASFTVAYEVFADRSDGTRMTYLRAISVLAPYSFVTNRPRRLNDEERTALEGYLEPAPTPRFEWSEPTHNHVGPWPVQVRFSDLDVYGHVNNVKYVDYFTEARLRLIGASSVSVVQTDLDYRTSLELRPEPYDVWCWISDESPDGVVFEAEIRDGDTQAARAKMRVTRTS